jgi:hypothetical protein
MACTICKNIEAIFLSEKIYLAWLTKYNKIYSGLLNFHGDNITRRCRYYDYRKSMHKVNKWMDASISNESLSIVEVVCVKCCY